MPRKKNESVENVVEKKKRGRPRKEQSSTAVTAKASDTAGKKRGRPRKVQVAGTAEQAVVSAAPAKKRGRPRKVEATTAAQTLAAAATTTAAPKRRGRPRKVQSELVETKVNEQAAPKRRGRPRKEQSVAQAVSATEQTASAAKKRGRPKKSENIKLHSYSLPKMANMEAGVAVDSYLFTRFTNDYNAAAGNLTVANAIANVGIAQASFNNDVLRDDRFVFSHVTKRGSITNQKMSGRCWLFAALNHARVNIMETLKVDDFELSENYLCFYEKIEKANSYLENVIATLDKDIYSREWFYINETAASDGGYFEWYADLVAKYGIVPKSCMPETFHSSNTDMMVEVINKRLKRTAMRMRHAYEAEIAKKSKPGKAFMNEMREYKAACLSEVYNILLKCLGTPPTEVNYSYSDKEKKKHEISNISPKAFYEKYCGLPLEDMVVLCHDATETYPHGTKLTYKYSSMVVDGQGLLQVLAPMEELTAAAVKSIKDGEPMWFACDVSKSADRRQGYLDDQVYLTDLTLTPVGEFSKRDRTLSGETRLNHAMLLCGVDLDKKDNPKRWMVENSWGDQAGQKGIFTMSQKWFEDYSYMVIVNKKYVNKKYLQATQKQVVELEPWQAPLQFKR